MPQSLSARLAVLCEYNRKRPLSPITLEGNAQDIRLHSKSIVSILKNAVGNCRQEVR